MTGEILRAGDGGFATVEVDKLRVILTLGNSQIRTVLDMPVESTRELIGMLDRAVGKLEAKPEEEPGGVK